MGSLFKSPVDGKTYDVAPEQVDSYLAQGYTPVESQERAAQVTTEAAEARKNERGAVGTFNAGLTSALSSATAGGSDVLLRGLLDKGQFDRLQGERETHDIASTAGAVVGALAPGGFGTVASRAGKVVSGAIKGGGGLAKVGGAAAGTGVEGALFGAGTATSELAMSDDPLTLERAASVYSSNMLFGGGVGSIVGGLTKTAELGLGKAKNLIDTAAARQAAAVAIPEDLAALDRAGLRAAEKTELEALEATRVPQRQQLADDLAAFREEAKQQKLWLATKKADDAAEGAAHAGEPSAPSAGAAGPLDEVEFAAWKDRLGSTLAPQDLATLNSYTKEGLFGQVNSEFRNLDGLRARRLEDAARRGRPAPDLSALKVPEHIQATADQIDRIIASSPAPREIVVYRGLKAGRTSERFGELKPGDTLVDPGYGSTSMADDVGAGYAKGFGNGSGTRLEITVPEGHPIAPISGSAFAAEKELLLPRGTKYHITSSEVGPDGHRLIKATIGDAPRGSAAGGHAPVTEDEFYALKDGYKGSLAPDELRDIREYTSDSAYGLNKQLRADRVRPQNAELVANVDAALEKAPAPRPLQVYRGLDEDALEHIGNLKPGDRFTDRAFGSTSIDPDVATRGKVLMTVDVPEGYPAAAVPSKSFGESEILLRRDTQYEIVSIARRAKSHDIFGDMTDVHVRVVGDAPPPRPPRVLTPDEAKAFSKAEAAGEKSPFVPVEVQRQPAPQSAPKLSPDDARAVREISKISLEADRVIDRTLRNPKALAENPRRALAGLQQQEHALERLVAKAEPLRASFAADASGARAAALDAIPAALERNRALQARISQLTAGATSERLGHITSAIDQLSTPGAKKTIAEQMAGGTAYGIGASVASAIPFVGPFLAPFAGAKAASLVSERVFGRMGKAMGELTGRAQKAARAFFDVTKRASTAAPVLATKVLSSVRYAAKQAEPGERPVRTRAPGAKQQPTLASAYRERADELRNQVAPGPDGRLAMRPDAREAVAARLSPVAAHNPVFADRLETNAVRRVEALANWLPKRPELAGIPTGPDRWQPSDMEMRTFARRAAAVEDPHGVFERLASGAITPEDAEVMRAVYPELMADFTRQIVERLPELREALPYQRRIALSIFTGVPVDPAMDPRILGALQASFANEPGTEGGTQAPMPSPQFGSVKAEEPTPSQKRAG